MFSKFQEISKSTYQVYNFALIWIKDSCNIPCQKHLISLRKQIELLNHYKKVYKFDTYLTAAGLKADWFCDIKLFSVKYLTYSHKITFKIFCLKQTQIWLGALLLVTPVIKLLDQNGVKVDAFAAPAAAFSQLENVVSLNYNHYLFLFHVCIGGLKTFLNYFNILYHCNSIFG